MIRYRFVFNPNKLVASDGTAPIVLEVAFNRVRKKIVNTGVRCKLKEWDSRRRRLNHNNELYKKINLKLDRIKNEIVEYQLDLENDGKEFTREALERYLSNEVAYASFNMFYQDKLDKQFDIKDSTRRDQQRTLDRLNEVNANISWGAFDRKLVESFQRYLIDDRGNSINTLAKHQKNLRKYTKLALLEELLKKDPYKGVKRYRVKGSRKPLTPLQLKKIESLDYCDMPSVKKVLDQFLFGCYSGMRFSNIQELRASQIEEEIIRYTPKKKGNDVTLVISKLPDGEKLKRILEEYNLGKGVIFPRLSSGETSRQLKKISIDAELDTGIIFHESRHTFCTQIARTHKNPFEVMRLTGIRKVETAMIYIKIAKDEEG